MGNITFGIKWHSQVRNALQGKVAVWILRFVTSSRDSDLPFSRSMEMEADALGMEIAARVGYKPEAAVTLWKKLQTASVEGGEFLSTHPLFEQRIAKAKELLPLLKASICG